MAEITSRRLGELIRGELGILRDKPDGLRARDVVAELEKIVPPTAFEKAPYESRPDVRRYDQVARFATIGPVKAGWITKSKGRWTATDAGRAALAKYTDPEALYREARRLYKQWKAERGEDTTVEEAAPDAVAEHSLEKAAPPAYDDAEASSWDEIKSHVSKMDPYQFQNLVAGLLSAMGYHVAWVAPPGPDHGIDIIAYPDPLGAKEPCVKVSVRRRVDKTDVKDIREFSSVLHAGDLGIFVSVAGFTKPAEDLARSDQRRLRLLDLDKLFDLWVEHYPKLTGEHSALLPLRPVWFLAVGNEA